MEARLSYIYQKTQFTLETKGRYQTNPGNMIDYKTQAGSGNYPRNFQLLVFHIIYLDKLLAKYHDPN